MDIITILYVVISIPAAIAIGFEIYDWKNGNHPLQTRTKK